MKRGDGGAGVESPIAGVNHAGAAYAGLAPARRLGGFFLFAAVVAVLPLLAPDNYFVTVVGVTIGLHVILAVSLNLFMGYAGQISLGHAAFAGIGAYTSAILTTRYAVEPWIAIGVALLVVAGFATLIARPILRLKGHYLAMATLGFGIIVNIVMVQEEAYTGGTDGMSGIPPLAIFGWTVDSDLEWYAVVAVVMLAAILASLNIAASRAGRALKALHGAEIAAQTMGVDTAKAKVQIFVFSALLACFAGSLFAHQQAFVSPSSFNFFASIELVTMVVLGGIGSTFGAVFGAVVLTLLPELLVVFEDFEMLIFGGILILMMIFLPQGLFVGIAQLLRVKLMTLHRRVKRGA